MTSGRSRRECCTSHANSLQQNRSSSGPPRTVRSTRKCTRAGALSCWILMRVRPEQNGPRHCSAYWIAWMRSAHQKQLSRNLTPSADSRRVPSAIRSRHARACARNHRLALATPDLGRHIEPGLPRHRQGECAASHASTATGPYLSDSNRVAERPAGYHHLLRVNTEHTLQELRKESSAHSPTTGRTCARTQAAIPISPTLPPRPGSRHLRLLPAHHISPPTGCSAHHRRTAQWYDLDQCPNLNTRLGRIPRRRTPHPHSLAAEPRTERIDIREHGNGRRPERRRPD